MEILLFVFFLIVFILMLTGGSIIKAIKKAKKNAQEAADRKEQRFRDEVGRQRQQYSQRQQPAQPSESVNPADSAEPKTEPKETADTTEETSKENARHTQMETGETIIDHHHEKRESRKIFDDEDGEYTDFEEVKD